MEALGGLLAHPKICESVHKMRVDGLKSAEDANFD